MSMPIPDYALAGTTRILQALLPLFLKTPGPVASSAIHARTRATVRRLIADPRAAARSTTLAADVAAITAGYRAAASDMRLVISGLLRVATGARGFVPVEARTAVLAAQRSNEQLLTLLFEAVALAECAVAVADIVPRSNAEASALRRLLTENFDLAIARASAFEQPLVQRSLRETQGKVARDLIERGRPLAHLVSYETAVPLPAVVLAHRLYQDAGRRDELVAENAGTDHPSFMPMTGRAYSR